MFGCRESNLTQPTSSEIKRRNFIFLIFNKKKKKENKHKHFNETIKKGKPI